MFLRPFTGVSTANEAHREDMCLSQWNCLDFVLGCPHRPLSGFCALKIGLSIRHCAAAYWMLSHCLSGCVHPEQGQCSEVNLVNDLLRLVRDGCYVFNRESGNGLSEL